MQRSWHFGGIVESIRSEPNVDTRLLVVVRHVHGSDKNPNDLSVLMRSKLKMESIYR